MKGSYILVISIDENVKISIGSLGKFQFKSGFYFYIGSAMGKSGSTTLINRVKRHVLPPDRKKVHWHIDYLLANRNSNIVRLLEYFSYPSLTQVIPSTTTTLA